jgi:excisionase family DNA binding protein
MSVPPHEDRRFLTAAEVGALLGLRKSRVYELAAAGALPAVRLGVRKLVFSLRAIEELEREATDRARTVREQWGGERAR